MSAFRPFVKVFVAFLALTPRITGKIKLHSEAAQLYFVRVYAIVERSRYAAGHPLSPITVSFQSAQCRAVLIRSLSMISSELPNGISFRNISAQQIDLVAQLVRQL